MGDKAYTSSSKPIPNPPPKPLNGAVANGGGPAVKPPAFPPTKAQQYGAVRPPYRPQPPLTSRRRRSRRGCCCVCCLWLTLILIALVFLAAIAAGVLYLLYHPQRPSFTVSSVNLSALNISSADLLNSRLDFTVTARNPNRKVVFVYGDIAISADSDGIGLGDGSIPGFVHETGNTTVLKAAVSSSAVSLDPTDASDLRKKKRFPLEIELETKVGFKIGSFKSKRIGIRVTCKGLNAAVEKKTKTAAASPSSSTAAKCKPRIKIWNWAF
ncbi:NDR1/HIN1-like protein 13 [Typha latifolia]|uniref:NDR1/HIN1-like protein 13 n=1 Tax=Typha latifolia TaxID=4733 RepID=UPI003C30C27F